MLEQLPRGPRSGGGHPSGVRPCYSSIVNPSQRGNSTTINDTTPPKTVRSARAPQDPPRGLPLRDAARLFGIDHRWIWLWAAQGRVSHVEIETADGRHKIVYSIPDIQRVIDTGPDTPAYPDRYWEDVAHKLGLDRLVGALAATG